MISALDNVAARLHVDRMCVLHRKPLLESGTAGTKANTQVVLPGLTASYGASTDPPDDDIPVCTVKAFPYVLEHCVQWARDLFEAQFVQAPRRVNAWAARPDALAAELGQRGAGAGGAGAGGAGAGGAGAGAGAAAAASVRGHGAAGAASGEEGGEEEEGGAEERLASVYVMV